MKNNSYSANYTTVQLDSEDHSSVFHPPFTSVYHFVIGAGALDNFDGASLAIKQAGIVLGTAVTAVTDKAHLLVNLFAQLPVTFVLTDIGDNTSITILIDQEVATGDSYN
jgi:hypothetical protein